MGGSFYSERQSKEKSGMLLIPNQSRRTSGSRFSFIGLRAYFQRFPWQDRVRTVDMIDYTNTPVWMNTSGISQRSGIVVTGIMATIWKVQLDRSNCLNPQIMESLHGNRCYSFNLYE